MTAAPKLATYDDVLASPPHVVAEVLRGTPHQSPRPAAPQAIAGSALGVELGSSFQRRRGGPGGWVILDEPELHLDREIVVPDLAGWRRERMPEIPLDAFFTLAPDWVCEILSPSTRALDRGLKLSIYAEHRVPHVWFVEPLERLIEVLRLDGETYRIVKTSMGDAPTRLEPFDAIELEVALLWAR